MHPTRNGPGYTGHVNTVLLDEILPPERDQLQYFLCGPDPMMDATEDALDKLDIPEHHVHAERFTMV